MGETYDPSLIPVAVLVLMILRGSRGWPWIEIVRRYQGQALALARSVVGDLHEAQDVVQEVLAKAHQQLARFDRSREFGPWLAGIVIHTALDWLRRSAAHCRQGLKGRGGDDILESSDHAPEPPAILIDREERQVLWQRVAIALQSLTAFERFIFCQFFVLDKPVVVIAKVCHKSEMAIHCTLSRAKKKFLNHFPGVKMINRELKELFAR